MPPLTTYADFGCEGIENVFYKGVPDVYSDENYQLKMFGVSGAMIPIGFHIEYFMATNYGDDNSNLTGVML